MCTGELSETLQKSTALKVMSLESCRARYKVVPSIKVEDTMVCLEGTGALGVEATCSVSLLC